LKNNKKENDQDKVISPDKGGVKNNLISPVDAGLFYIVGYAIYLISNNGGNHETIN
tara:strand:+ start:5943 stop:6110 length:168 start_codon:yes stop_codon:yes gene_type:complete